jgi:hypothetical protein
MVNPGYEGVSANNFVEVKFLGTVIHNMNFQTFRGYKKVFQGS